MFHYSYYESWNVLYGTIQVVSPEYIVLKQSPKFIGYDEILYRMRILLAASAAAAAAAASALGVVVL